MLCNESTLNDNVSTQSEALREKDELDVVRESVENSSQEVRTQGLVISSSISDVSSGEMKRKRFKRGEVEKEMYPGNTNSGPDEVGGTYQIEQIKGGGKKRSYEDVCRDLSPVWL